MAAVELAGDPKHNGPHVCPRCGSLSTWKARVVPAGMIEVSCEGDCQGYTMSYAQLITLPHFIECATWTQNQTAEFPRKLHDRPVSTLTMQWHETERGKLTTRYSGSDGFLYECIDGQDWLAVGKISN
jgi:hypothetical protein